MMLAFHTLYTGLCPLIFVLESGDLVSHRMQLLQLMLEALLLCPELLLLYCFGFLFRSITHLHVGLGASCVARTRWGHAFGRLATRQCRVNLSHLTFIIEQEANALVSFRCLVKVLTRPWCYVCHLWVTLVSSRHSIGGQEALFADQRRLLLVCVLVAHNSADAARDGHLVLSNLLHWQPWLLIKDTWARFVVLSVHIIAHLCLIICILFFEHHAGGLLDVLKLGVEFGLAWILCHWDLISSLILVLVLLLVTVLVSWLEHLLYQFLPLRLFVHYLDIKLGYLCGRIFHANRHFL